MSRYSDLMQRVEKAAQPNAVNNSGGPAFLVDDFTRLDRFVIMGSETPTYYQSAKKLTKENAKCIERCYETDPTRTIERIVELSLTGRAPKNDHAIFALAVGSINPKEEVRRAAFAALPKVCRTSTHLFTFLNIATSLGRGWGRTMKRAVAAWYDEKNVDKLAYQVIKYRQRDGLTHQKVLRHAHPGKDTTGRTETRYKVKGTKKTVQSKKGTRIKESPRASLYRWICGKEISPNGAPLPDLIAAHTEAMQCDITKARDKKKLLRLLCDWRLPWEAIPTSCLKDRDVWEVMLPSMNCGALLRNLPAMTEYGVLAPLGPNTKWVRDMLLNKAQLTSARIHPFNVLIAYTVYGSGKSVKGNRTWSPVKQVTDILEEAFYLSFQGLVPSGKRKLIAIDCSSSMTWEESRLMHTTLTAREGAAAMSMASIRCEQDYHVMGFCDSFREFKFTARSRLEDVVHEIANTSAGGTDCSLPMKWAQQHRVPVDVFEIYTDNETNAYTNPMAALRSYRQHMGINAKLIVSGMTSTGFTIADPNDGGCLDVVGFDSYAPGIISNFARDVHAAASDADEDDTE